MLDPRLKKVAEILVNHSTRVKKGDVVKVNMDYDAKDLSLEIYKLIVKKGAYPMVETSLPGAAYTYFKYASNEQLKQFPKLAMYTMKNIDVLIRIGADINTKELSNSDPKRIALRRKVLNPLSKEMLRRVRWVIFEYPTNALAQDADMSLEEFENFVFKSTNLDWKKLGKGLNKIGHVFQKSKHVRIIGEETDIEMDIEGKKVVVDSGENNMPGGEIFTAPNKKTVNGKVYYNFPVVWGGREVDGVRLEFKNGRCVRAKADKNEKFLREMIKTDKGSSYIGELGIGCNPGIKKFVKQILFDEKLDGSVHLALGNAYPECGGGNNSAVHWDMIKDLRKNGEIYLDKKLIQKNGKWLI